MYGHININMYQCKYVFDYYVNLLAIMYVNEHVDQYMAGIGGISICKYVKYYQSLILVYFS